MEKYDNTVSHVSVVWMFARLPGLIRSVPRPDYVSADWIARQWRAYRGRTVASQNVARVVPKGETACWRRGVLGEALH